MKESKKQNCQGNEDDTLTEDVSCPRRAACMDGSGQELCQVVRYSNHSELLKCLDDKYCESKLQFADIYFCTCPVRSEIFRRDKG